MFPELQSNIIRDLYVKPSVRKRSGVHANGLFSGSYAEEDLVKLMVDNYDEGFTKLYNVDMHACISVTG